MKMHIPPFLVTYGGASFQDPIDQVKLHGHQVSVPSLFPGGAANTCYFVVLILPESKYCPIDNWGDENVAHEANESEDMEGIGQR